MPDPNKGQTQCWKIQTWALLSGKINYEVQA